MTRLLRKLGPLFLAITLTAGAPAPQAVQLDVAVNGKTPPQPLPRTSIRAVFLLKAQFWATGQPIVIVLQPNDAQLHAAFCGAVLEAPCSNLEDAELEKRYQGTLFARVVRATSATEAAQVLQDNPTAVGYFRRGTAPPGARVVYQP